MGVSVGTRLGPYEILGRLGSGGMGEVFRARDTRLGRDVAVKVLPEEFASDPNRLRRFEKEARAASALNHPNVVTIYEIGSSEAISWIAMEQVEGKTLRDVLISGGMPLKKILAIAAQIGDGLARAHEAGIVHRDLKPENVMVTKDGLVKILDFGLAKRSMSGSGSDDGSHLPTQTGTSPGLILGTVGYMSPEQAVGQTIDFRSDQFAFGSILYEMATGKGAFLKDTAIDTLSAILHEEPRPVSEVNPQSPAPLWWIVERCLAKEPRGRYASTDDLARDLATLRDRLSETSSGGSAPVAASARRRYLPAAVLTLVAFLALVAGLFAGIPVWKARFSSRPMIRQVTFRRNGIQDARFAPDGQIVYGALPSEQSEGDLGELFAARPGAFEPRSLGLPRANILSISSLGEMAILVGGAPRQGMLATVDLAGGAPRELLENVRRAAWAPDGKSLAVIHVVKGVTRLEFPIGRVLYEPPGYISGLRFSPQGNLIAFSNHRELWSPGASSHGELTVMDLAGKRRKIPNVPSAEFLWSSGGDEIWFPEIQGGTTSLWAVTMSGEKRLLAAFPGDFVLHDVSRDGRLLLERAIEEFEIVGRFPGDPGERNLSWLDGSVPAALSGDGKTLLFSEIRQGGPAVYKRKTDGSPAVRLGEGIALDLSPDGTMALCTSRGTPVRLILLPTGAGQARTLTLPGSLYGPDAARFFPDGRRVLARVAEAGHRARLFTLDIETGRARPFSPEGIPVSQLAVSPDGKRVISSTEDEERFIYDVEGGARQSVPGLPKGFYVIAWCSDGRSVFVRTSGIHPLKIFRLDLTSGQMEPWKEFSISDIGMGLAGVIPTPDGKSYVYGYQRSFSDLFIVEGLK